MVNYKEAFALPFVYWRRLLVYLVMMGAAIGPFLFFFLRIFISFMNNLDSMQPEIVNTAFSMHNLYLLFLSFVIMFPFLFFLQGYYYKLIASAAQGKNQMPGFTGVGSMFLQALKALAAGLVYWLAIAAVILVFVLVFSLKILALSVIFGLMAAVAALIFFFALIYVLPMLMAHFSAENRFSAFFEWKRAVKLAFTIEYFVPWIVAIGVSFGASLVARILNLPFSVFMSFASTNSISSVLMGPLLIMFGISMLVQTIASLISGNLYGQAYRDAVAAKKGGNTVAAAKRV